MTQDNHPPPSESPPTPLNTQSTLRRHFAAMFYDWLLAISIAMIYTYIAIWIKMEVTGANYGDKAKIQVSGIIYQFSLAVVIFLFYGFFWVKLGQTLGMQAWRLKVTNEEGNAITWPQALLRFLMAFVSFFCLAAGYWLSLFNKDKLTWHDRVSKTKLVLLPKKKR